MQRKNAWYYTPCLVAVRIFFCFGLSSCCLADAWRALEYHFDVIVAQLTCKWGAECIVICIVCASGRGSRFHLSMQSFECMWLKKWKARTTMTLPIHKTCLNFLVFVRWGIMWCLRSSWGASKQAPSKQLQDLWRVFVVYASVSWLIWETRARTCAERKKRDTRKLGVGSRFLNEVHCYRLKKL